MGKDLHPSIRSFFVARMHEHDAVSSVEMLNDDDDFLYDIRRARFGDSITVWLSDAYLFTDAEFHNRPASLSEGDYIIVGKPEGGIAVDYELLRQYKIGVGKIGKFMGALNFADLWRFLTAEERDKLGTRSL
jgi:hypothetical protein